MSKPIKVLVVVQRGIVQLVNSNTNDIEIVIVDMDSNSDEPVVVTEIQEPDYVDAYLYNTISDYPDSLEKIAIDKLKEYNF